MIGQKVILWNSAGLRASTDSTAAKFAFFDSQFSNAKFSIAAFVETHHKDDQDFTPDLGQFEKPTIFYIPLPPTKLIQVS